MKPTKEQLKKCIESRGKEGIADTLIFRKISIIITKYIVRTNLSPNSITFISFIIGLIAAYFLALGLWKFLIIGGILVFISYTLDDVDGEVARLKKMGSAKGAWLDMIFDRIREAVLFFGICFGLYGQTLNYKVWIYGFIALVSIYLTEIIADTTKTRLESEKLRKAHSNFFLTKILTRLKIKPQFLTLGIDVRLLAITIFAIINQLIIMLWLFMIFQNLYWIIMMLLVYFKKEK